MQFFLFAFFITAWWRSVNLKEADKNFVFQIAREVENYL